MKRVVVHIGRLVLTGLRHEDRQEVTLGVRQRLEQVLGDPQALQQFTEAGDMPQLRWDTLSLAPGAGKEMEK